MDDLHYFCGLMLAANADAQSIPVLQPPPPPPPPELLVLDSDGVSELSGVVLGVSGVLGVLPLVALN